MLFEEILVPLILPKHPISETEELFCKFKEKYLINLHSAMNGDIHRLIYIKQSKKYLKPDNNLLVLKHMKSARKFSAHWLILFVCKPWLTPEDIWDGKLCRKGHKLFSKWTVDHINNIHNDHRVENLRWLTRTEHAGLSARRYHDNGKRPQRHTTSHLLKDERVIYKDSTVFDELAIKYGCPSLSYIGVTNKGRIRMKSGKYTRGYVRYLREYDHLGKVRRKMNGRYRRVKIDKREFSVHVLIMTAKLNCEIPKGYVVMHRDDIPLSERLDEEGTERNWIGDLCVGTSSDNALSYYQNQLTSS